MLTKVCIEAIDTAGRSRRARRIRFDDGTERVTAASAVKALGLESGMSLAPPELDSMLAGVEPQLARDRALRLLGYRDRSTRELARRLEDDGYPEKVVRSLVDSLHTLGLVDDVRFAERLVETRVATGYGSRRILHELLECGIGREEAEALLEASEAVSFELDRLRALLRARPPADSHARERLLKKLVSRGFPPATVLDAMSDLAEMGDEPPGLDGP